MYVRDPNVLHVSFSEPSGLKRSTHIISVELQLKQTRQIHKFILIQRNTTGHYGVIQLKRCRKLHVILLLFALDEVCCVLFRYVMHDIKALGNLGTCNDLMRLYAYSDILPRPI